MVALKPGITLITALGPYIAYRPEGLGVRAALPNVLIATYNSNSKGSSTPFWPLQALVARTRMYTATTTDIPELRRPGQEGNI